MGRFRLARLLDLVAGVDPLVGLLWLGLVGLTVTLIVLMRTRWGQSQPLRKCLVLSVLTHLLLAGYATTVHIVSSASLRADEPVMRVSITDADVGKEFIAQNSTTEAKPWESFSHESVVEPEPPEMARPEAAESPEPERQPRKERTGLSVDPSLEHLTPADVVQPKPGTLPSHDLTGPTARSGKASEPIEAPSAERRPDRPTSVPHSPQPERRSPSDTVPLEPQRSHRSGLPFPLLEQPQPLPRLSDLQTTPDPEQSLAGMRDLPTRGSQGKPAESAESEPRADSPASPMDVESMPGAGPAATDADRLKPPSLAMRGDGGPLSGAGGGSVEGGMPAVGPPLLPMNRRESTENQVPAIYRLRVAPDRSKVAQLHGATGDSEAAVKAALAWLANAQAPDGHWDAETYGAGREQFVAGRDRQRAGTQADTGITGLALLAFLASGHTHQEGLYKSNVRRGLQHLLNIQGRNGNLGAGASTYGFMYCHAMAAFALSEAYGMTGDPRLREPVQRAVGYTLAAQDRSGGGWRYKPGDPGDTSQLGWQLMALKSAELAGVPIPDQCRRGALRYLDSVSSGQYGGLAAYRPVEQATRPMTAEALVCRVFLGVNPSHAAFTEAGDFLLAELPGDAKPNLYYWYYATLGMYHLQGVHWDQWNSALQKTLVSSQQKKGPLAGSWDPDTVWGGYGGRVYSTALATLCLEVYYRFLPLYLEASVPRHPLR